MTAAAAHKLAHGLDVVREALLGLDKVGRDAAEKDLMAIEKRGDVGRGSNARGDGNVRGGEGWGGGGGGGG